LARCFIEFTPGTVGINTERFENFTKVLAQPGAGPRCNGTLDDAQVRIGHHELFGRIKLLAHALTIRAHALGRIRGEMSGGQSPASNTVLGVENFWRVVSGSREQQAQ
jgi:hypothetical protein